MSYLQRCSCHVSYWQCCSCRASYLQRSCHRSYLAFVSRELFTALFMSRELLTVLFVSRELFTAFVSPELFSVRVTWVIYSVVRVTWVIYSAVRVTWVIYSVVAVTWVIYIVRVHQAPSHENLRGMELQTHPFLISTPKVNGQFCNHGRFTPQGNSPLYPLNGGPGGQQSVCSLWTRDECGRCPSNRECCDASSLTNKYWNSAAGRKNVGSKNSLRCFVTWGHLVFTNVRFGLKYYPYSEYICHTEKWFISSLQLSPSLHCVGRLE